MTARLRLYPRPHPRRAGVVLLVLTALLLVACSEGAPAPAPVPVPPSMPDQALDLVLLGGRVVDPESGLDAIRNVGVRGGRIVAISEAPLSAPLVLEVRGLVVAPGFIDLHSHAQTPLGQHFQVRDGVTTALELEAGAYPVTAMGTHAPIAIAGQSMLHFGASVGHAFIRARILEGEGAAPSLDATISRAIADGESAGMGGPAFTEPLDAAQRARMRALLHDGLDRGGLGIGLLLDYMSEVVDAPELRAVFEVAGERRAPVFVHIRRGVAGDPAGLVEVIALAEQTGAPLHVCHVQANAMGEIASFLRQIREARDRGARVTTESFPYNSGSTSISAAVFGRDWQKIFDITYADVEWAATGERFDEATWNDYRQRFPSGQVIHHYNREEWTRVASEADDVIVASDAMPAVVPEQKVAPVGIGTFSRVLGRYVRDEGSLALGTAISKMTLQPARVLEESAPAFRNKGRLAVGADADITVFDAATVRDNATYQDPYQASTGIVHVIVDGVPVVRDGVLQAGVRPGQRILGAALRPAPDA